MLDEGYERSSLTEVEAVLDSLSPATSEQVYSQTLGMSPRAVAAVAASRADAGGGGGGGGPTLLGPFTVPYNDPGVNNTFSDLTELDAGTIVLRAFGFSNGWVNTPDGLTMEVTVHIHDPGEETFNEIYRVNNANVNVTGVELKEDLQSGNEWVPLARVGLVPDEAGWVLGCTIFVNGGDTPTAGAIDFYALVQVPA